MCRKIRFAGWAILTTYRKQHLDFISGPKTASTSSPSFLRSKPWSTKTHVNWLPIAFERSTAATRNPVSPGSPAHTVWNENAIQFCIQRLWLFRRLCLAVLTHRRFLYRTAQHMHHHLSAVTQPQYGNTHLKQGLVCDFFIFAETYRQTLFSLFLLFYRRRKRRCIRS